MDSKEEIERQLQGLSTPRKKQKKRDKTSGITREHYPSNIQAGTKLRLKMSKLYIDNVTKKVYTVLSCYAYAFDSIKINERIRIVANKENVGNLNCRLFWVNIDDIEIEK